MFGVQMKFKRLTQAIVSQIEAGTLQFGQRLPSIRDLSLIHKVSKNTVLRALEELESLSYVAAKQRKGFYVCWYKNKPASKVDVFRSKAKALNLPQVFHELMEKGAAFDWYPFCDEKFQSGYLLNLHRCIYEAARQNQSQYSGYYDSPLGDAELRQQVANRYQLRNLYVMQDSVMITSGCQNALYLSLKCITSAGDVVAIESPAFYGALQILESLQLKVIEIPINSNHSLDVMVLAEYCKANQVKACVVTPAYATPTGLSMQDDDKIKLLNLAQEHNFYVVEDDIYGELGFVTNPSPIASYDKDGRVLLCGSWSKSLSRDLRLGWVVSKRFIPELIKLKLNMQLASSKSTQVGLAHFMAKGHFRRHLNALVQHLKEQRVILLSELKQYWPDNVEYELPQGGLTLWIKLPNGIDSESLYKTLAQQNILLTPGILFASDNRFSEYIRLSFMQPIVNERKKALRKIGRLIKDMLS
jgi:DNA-binding transcriptional MocR family regulator